MDPQIPAPLITLPVPTRGWGGEIKSVYTNSFVPEIVMYTKTYM